MADYFLSGERGNSRWAWLRKTGGVSALIAGALLLVGIISLIDSVLRPGAANGWLSLFGNNWLVKIFILHAGINGIPADLQGLNFLDVFILLLVAFICLGLSAISTKGGKVWSLIAFTLSLIAIALFLATQNAGRSTVMLAVLIISFVLLRDKRFDKVTIYLGILAGILLFAGDLTVGIHSSLITVLFGIGYLLLLAWFFLITKALLSPAYTS